MPSELNLCNLALSFIGEHAVVTNLDPPDGSVQASLCARFYPLVRDTLLLRHPWRFAIRRQWLALMDKNEDGTYRYALPADCLRPLELIKPGDFIVEQDTLLTKQDQAGLRYITRQTDSNAFSPLFGQALCWHLASQLAGALIKGASGAQQAQQCLATGERILNEAMSEDAKAQQVRLKHAPSLMAARD